MISIMTNLLKQMGGTVSSVSVTTTSLNHITDQEINMILQWEAKRNQVYSDIQDLYQQYEDCQKEHPLIHPLSCASYLTRIHRKELEYQHLTTNTNRWFKSNHLYTRPIYPPKV